jgi:hypothetical protein
MSTVAMKSVIGASFCSSSIIPGCFFAPNSLSRTITPLNLNYLWCINLTLKITIAASSHIHGTFSVLPSKPLILSLSKTIENAKSSGACQPKCFLMLVSFSQQPIVFLARSLSQAEKDRTWFGLTFLPSLL